MTKKVLLGISIAAILTVGLMFTPALAAIVAVVGGGVNQEPIEEFKVRGESATKIKRIIIETDDDISKKGKQGWIGYGFFTDVPGLVVVATSHGPHPIPVEGIGAIPGFYDNIKQGASPSASPIGLPVLAQIISNEVPFVGDVKFKVLCAPGDVCGPDWHIHYAKLTFDTMCASGIEIASLSYAQKGNVKVMEDRLVLSYITKTPNDFLNAAGPPGTEFDNYAFSSVGAPVAFGITGEVDDTFAPHACVNPISGDDDDDDDDDDEDDEEDDD